MVAVGSREHLRAPVPLGVLTHYECRPATALHVRLDDLVPAVEVDIDAVAVMADKAPIVAHLDRVHIVTSTKRCRPPKQSRKIDASPRMIVITPWPNSMFSAAYEVDSPSSYTLRPIVG